MGWDDDDAEDWEKEAEKEEPELKPVAKKSEWSDEEEEEEDEDEGAKIAQMRKDREKLLKDKEDLEKKIAEIEEKLPHEKPKESSKKGKQSKKLLAMKDEEDRRAREEALRAESQVSRQQKIEESDFANAQDLFAAGGGAAVGEGSGKFEQWILSEGSKQAQYEDFAVYVATKVSSFSEQFLYIALLRKLVGESTKMLEARQVKELLLVLTKGRDDFSVIDLVRSLLRDADKDIPAEEITALLFKKAEKKAPAKDKKAETISSRGELFKVLLQDIVKDMKPEDVLRIVEDGCGVTLTRDQQAKIAALRAELAGDPAALKDKGKTSARVADHKSMTMYDAFGSGGGEEWGGGGGTRGDDVDFM